MSFVNVYKFVCVLHSFLAASRNVNVNKCVYKCASFPFGFEERFDSHNDIPQVAQRNVSIVAHKAAPKSVICLYVCHLPRRPVLPN